MKFKEKGELEDVKPEDEFEGLAMKEREGDEAEFDEEIEIR